jgi:hypothetical protein
MSIRADTRRYDWTNLELNQISYGNTELERVYTYDKPGVACDRHADR